MSRKDLQGSGPSYKRSEALGDWKPVPGSDDGNLIDLPMAGNSYEHMKRNVPVDRNSIFGVRGDNKENLEVNPSDDIEFARRLDDEGIDYPGIRIVTGRSKASKFSGAK